MRFAFFLLLLLSLVKNILTREEGELNNERGTRKERKEKRRETYEIRKVVGSSEAGFR